jgi:hypothetical protein
MREWIAALVILALLSFGGYELWREHAARVKAEAAAAVQQKTIDAAKTEQAQTTAQLKQTLASLEKQRSSPATPQRIASNTSKLIPNLPAPLVIENAPLAPGTKELPNTPQPQQIVIPAADFKAIQDAEIDCQEGAAKLAACMLTSADQATELKATEAQRDDYKTAMKGGSFWSRVKHDAIVIGVSAGVGYAAGRIQK